MAKLIGYMFLIVVGVLLRAWVLSTLWGWFVVAHFGVKSITLPVAYGLSAIVAMFQHATNQQQIEQELAEKSEATRFARAFGQTIIAPLAALAFGAIANIWMP